DEVIDALEAALRAFDESKYQVPARDGFEYQDPAPGLLEWMPAMECGGEITVKLVGYHPRNPALEGLPTILSTALTFDTATGHLGSIVDGTFPTAIRTGAASAVASRILANPESRILGIIGCGAQSMAQVHGMTRVFDLERVLVYDIDSQASRSFSERLEILDLADLEIEVAPLESVVRTSHVLCTATSVEVGRGPVMPDVAVDPALHINAIGSDFPGKRELTESLLKRSFVCPDFRPQAVREGECQVLDDEDIGPDLAELVKHETLYAGHREDLTVFDSTGWALEDHVVVGILVRHGVRLGLGTSLQLEAIAGDPKNPYVICDERDYRQVSERNREDKDQPLKVVR
ncbi:MAG: ornithine cyclodeaminase family protein, partial [Gammaproteobacteria bacterium]|nr:ornithine cyclodeaminase family protein [Gammaproteobacteria bacterium]